MKVEARVLDVTSTLGGEKVGMSIDQSALSHIMSVLTDLYSDPEMAVIREYSTNALDAHKERGINRPIDVTLPTAMSPYFKVRDFGAGLDADDIRDIYSRYGTSTKRNSNDVVGMLGLGCKSALTYTDQFTLSGIKAGVMTQVAIGRDEDGAGSMTIVYQGFTDEESGVEIVVPVKSGNGFERKSRDFFRFWEKGDVLVNGKQPERIDGLWITDDILLTTETNQSYVVMGNVAYPRLEASINYRTHSVCFVPIGTVQFTPSRESLQMTTKTKEALSALNGKLKKERNDSVQRQINAAPTHHQAIIMYLKGKEVGYDGEPEYKGDKMPNAVSLRDDKGVGYDFLVATPRSSYKPNKAQTYRSINVPGYVEAGSLWFKGFTAADWSKTKRAKLEQWAALEGVTLTDNVVLVPHLPFDEKWLDPSKVFDWAPVEAQKLPKEVRTARQDGRPAGSYSGFVANTWDRKIVAGDIDTTKPIYWTHGSASYGYRAPEIGFIYESQPDATIVVLPSNRIAKFQRDFPMAVRLSDGVAKIVNKWYKGLTDDDKMAISVCRWREHDTLAKLDSSKILCNDVKAAITAAKRKDGHEMLKKYDFLSRISALPQLKPSNLATKYPLAFGGYNNNAYANLSHTALYINAVCAAEMEV